MWYVWFFDGIGSTIVSLIAGAIIGGFTGYKIGIHKKNKINEASSECVSR